MADQGFVLIGEVEIPIVPKIRAIAVLYDPGAGAGRTVALAKMVGFIVVVPADDGNDMVVGGGDPGVIITVAHRQVPGIIVEGGGDRAVFQDQIFDALHIRTVHETGVLQVGGVLVCQILIQAGGIGAAVGRQGFGSCAGPFCQGKHGEQIVSACFQIILVGRDQTGGIVLGVSQRIVGGVVEKIGQMQFRKIDGIGGEPLLDQARLTG